VGNRVARSAPGGARGRRRRPLGARTLAIFLALLCLGAGLASDFTVYACVSGARHALAPCCKSAHRPADGATLARTCCVPEQVLAEPRAPATSGPRDEPLPGPGLALSPPAPLARVLPAPDLAPRVPPAPRPPTGPPLYLIRRALLI
jgi:hypothetical protein